MVEQGIGVISYGDTTGMATPRRVVDVIHALRNSVPELVLNMHFHDTRGTGLANVVTALGEGIDYLDASVGGMGGSPFAQGATGNIATEDLVHMLEDMGVATRIDLDSLLHAAGIAQEIVGTELPSKVLKAGPRLRAEAGAGAEME
jgi:hydroxymethylglutaryl-CoA lyase